MIDNELKNHTVIRFSSHHFHGYKYAGIRRNSDLSSNLKTLNKLGKSIFSIHMLC